MRRAFSVGCLAVLLGASAAYAAPKGTVIVKRTRQEFRDVEWEVQGDRVEVKLSYGSRFFPRDDLLLVPMASSEPQSEETDEESADGPSALAWHARCRLSPADGWESVSPSNPRRLIELKHRSGARLALSLVPVEADFDLTDGRSASALKDWVQRDLETSYVGVRLRSPGVEELFGANVLSVGPLSVQPVGGKERLSLRQVRFRRYGFEYVISLLTSEDQEGTAIQDRALELFRGFSFLPAVSRTRTRYSDFGRGFSVKLPGPDWEMIDRPFSSTEPITMRSEAGDATLTVTLTDGTNAANHVRDMLSERRSKSKYFSKDRTATTKLDGADVERFQFEDFQPGGRKKQRYHGFAIAMQGKVVTFLGVSPLTHPEARRVEGEIDETLSSTRIYDKVSMADRLERLRDAAGKLASGYAALDKKSYGEARDDFDDAISLNPDSALAYFLRGQAKRGLNDFEGFKADLDRALQLDPEGGYDSALGPSYAAEATQAIRDKDYARALEYWEKALDTDDDSEEYLTGFAKCLKDGFTFAARERDADVHRLASDAERAARQYDDEEPVIEALAAVYKLAVSNLQRTKDYSKAKRWAKKLRSLDGHREEGDKLYDSIKAIEEREKGR